MNKTPQKHIKKVFMPKNCFLQLFIYLKITKGFFDKENKSKVIGKLKRSNKTFY